MSAQATTQSRAIVFKRWSRKSYAIFAGLGRAITIGVLSVSICTVAMLKSGVITATGAARCAGEQYATDSDATDADTEQATADAAVATATSSTNDACAPHKTYFP